MSGRTGSRDGRVGRGKRRPYAWVAALAAFAAWGANVGARGDDRVTLVRTPAGGVQPQAVVDAEGAIHVVYFRGADAGAGDLDYVRIDPGSSADRFTPPVRVNSQPGSAVAKGTIRGAQIAIGRGGRLHVAWNGSGQARPANPNGGAPMLYARSDTSRTAFEPQRDLMRRSLSLDGGGTVAADGQGRVFVAWHGRPVGGPEGETSRRLLFTRSDDDGATFTTESPAVDEPTGACACCGTRALATASGSLHLLFRAATTSGDRDMMLVSSADHGGHFEARRAHPWKLNMCPMSSSSLAETPTGVLAAWETQGQIFVAKLDASGAPVEPPAHPRGTGGNRKHPSLACNARGDYLVAWAEDTSFTKGGALAWRVFDRNGKPTAEAGRVDDGIPLYGLPAAVARPDGRFLIVH